MTPGFSRDSAQKAGFVLSLAVLAFLYGFAARAFGWFPDDQLETAWRQLVGVGAMVWTGYHPATEPRVFDREGARTVSPPVHGGVTLVPSIWRDLDWKPGLKLIDADGRAVHEWRIDPADIFPEEFFRPLADLMEFNEPKNAHLFPNGDVVFIVGETGTARLDACGDLEWRVKADHHHSLTRADDGTFWISGRTPEPGPDPFTDADSVRHDVLVQLSGGGDVLRRIPVFDVVRRNEELRRRHMRFRPEDTHLNDVESLPDSLTDEYPLFDAGDLLVSLRHLNVVFVLDPESLEVIWQVDEPFVLQHDPDFVGDGWIGVFDNNYDGTDRGTDFGGIRILAYQPHTDSTDVLFAPSDSDSLYTPTRGNWQRLGDGRFLVTESNAGRVVEVDREGRIVWEWIQERYNEARVPVVSRAKRYDLTVEEVGEWPCSP